MNMTIDELNLRFLSMISFSHKEGVAEGVAWLELSLFQLDRLENMKAPPSPPLLLCSAASTITTPNRD